MISRSDVLAARARIAGHVRRPPLLDVESATRPLWLKLEYLQHTGVFKARGAFNRILAAREDRELDPTVGIVAASGGNAGLAHAYAAAQLGLPATVFVPVTAPETKVRRLRDYGATVNRVGAEYAEAYAAAQHHVATTGAVFCHAYDQLEVVAVEPTTSPTLHEAMAAGRPVDVPVSGIAADSLGARRVGEIAFHVATRTPPRSVLVDDAAIIRARADLWARYRIPAEHGAAAAFAALTAGRYEPADGENVVVVICGANTDTRTLDAVPVPD